LETKRTHQHQNLISKRPSSQYDQDSTNEEHNLSKINQDHQFSEISKLQQVGSLSSLKEWSCILCCNNEGIT
jgi:hypothetical protein